MTDGGHGGQLDPPCMLHMSVNIRGNGKGISECPMNALVMQVQQVADADAVGDFTGCRNIVTHHLGVVHMVDPHGGPAVLQQLPSWVCQGYPRGLG